jgi:translation initiation factor IF-1
MVKNTKGGKGAKSMARKSTASGGGGFPIPTCELEQIAIVSKMYGPACEVLLNDGTKLLCHIRNKFKGRHKSGNLIIVGSIVLVGYRDWEPDTARKNCDLLFVYDNLQASSLADRFSIPSIASEYSTSSSDFVFDNSTYDHSHDDTNTTNTTTLHTNNDNDFSFDDL